MSISLLPLKVGHVLDYITTTSEVDNAKNVTELKNSVSELAIMVGCLAFFTYFRYISLQFLQ